MSPLKKSLDEAMKDAMRAKEKFRLGVIRMTLAEIQRVEVDERVDVDDARCLAIIDKMAKQRRDAANQFVDGGRQDDGDALRDAFRTKRQADLTTQRCVPG